MLLFAPHFACTARTAQIEQRTYRYTVWNVPVRVSIAPSGLRVCTTAKASLA